MTDDNVIEFPNKECFSYFESDSGLGIQDKTCFIKVFKSKFFKDKFKIQLGNKCFIEMDRSELAEFMWAASTFIDSDERYRLNKEIVGCD